MPCVARDRRCNGGYRLGMRRWIESVLVVGVLIAWWGAGRRGGAIDSLREGFVAPPAEARPWVYWYFMDGNMSKEGITADLEAMKAAGIGGAIFLEVDIGIG